MVETASKSMYNWRRYPSSNCREIDENVRFWIWRCAVAPSEAAEKNGNIGAQLQSLSCTTASKIFWKIYFLYDFCCAQTCSFWAIFYYKCEFLTICCQLQIATCRKIYRCTSVFSALNQCGKTFVKIFLLSIRSWAHKLLGRFLEFSQFSTAISQKFVVPPATKTSNLYCFWTSIS